MRTIPRDPAVPKRHVTSVAWMAVAVAVAVAAIVGGRGALDRLRDGEAAAPADPQQLVETATASVRDLAETYSATGTLRFDDPIAVAAPAAGTVVTLVDTGDTLASGEVLAIVDDRAVVWLAGEVPAWRSLDVGDEGIDVLQLETALTGLGFDGDGDVTVDEEYTAATATMVEEWQAAIGVPETGRIDAGTVVFGATRDRVAAVGAAVGDAVVEGATLVSVGERSRYAQVTAVPAEAVTLVVGDTVAVELPSGVTIGGEVERVESGSEAWTITIGFDDGADFPTTDVTNVEIEWDHAVASGVLTIPSAALLRLDDGGYTVDVANPDGSTTRTPVTIGAAVGTRVEIVSGLDDGTRIVTL